MQKTLTGESVISGLIEAYNRKDQEEIVKIAFGLVEHEDNGARKEIIDVLGKDIGSITDREGRSLAHDMVKYGNDEVRKKIIDVLGKDIGSIKDGYGRSLAHDMVKYGNDEVRKKIIDVLGKDIWSIKDNDLVSVAYVSVRYGGSEERKKVIGVLGKEGAGTENIKEDFWNVIDILITAGGSEERKKIIDVLGKDIGSIIIDEYGRSLAHRLVKRRDNEVHKEIIDVLGKDIGSITDREGRSLAHEIVEYGNDEVRKKIIDVLGKDIWGIKDEGDLSIADMLFDEGDIEVKVKALLALGVIKSDEELFTERVLENTDNIYSYYRSFLKEIKKLNESSKQEERPNIPLICSFFVEQTKLNKELKNKLAELFDDDNEVEKIVLIRNLIYYNRRTEEDFKYIVSTKSGKQLRKSLSALTSINDLRKKKVISTTEKASILQSDDLEKNLGILLANKARKHFGAEVSDKALDAMIQKPNFAIDLFRFNSLYARSAANAHNVLSSAMKAYFQSGIEGFKNFKFYGHELADTQLDVANDIEYLKEKLRGIDKLDAEAQPIKVSKTDAVWTEVQNYKAHKDELFLEAGRISEEVSGELNSVAIKASKSLQKLIENRDVKGMKAKSFGEEEKLKRKAIALILLENAVESIEKAEELIKRVGGAMNNANLGEVIRKDAESSESVVESLKMFNKALRKRYKSEEGAVLALDNMIAVLDYLQGEKAAESRTITASFTFDPSEILTFGRYGASGAGNCQSSSSQDARLNQSLMSMLVDSNQLMMRFAKQGSDETIGFLQVHLLRSSKGTILLLENPYTNQPNKSETIRRAAKELAAEAELYLGMGVKAYFREAYGFEDAEIIEATIPKSYVNRYIDAISGQMDKGEHEIKFKAKKVVKDVSAVSIRR